MKLKQLFSEDVSPQVFVMDRDMVQIKAAQIVFSQAYSILYAWHIEKNVLVHASQYVKDIIERDQLMKDWAKVINSISVTSYSDNWEAFQNTYLAKYLLLISYLQDTWLGTWKIMMVRAWVDQHLHFGNRATSRVERAHSMLKSYLQVSTRDLRVVYDKISLLLVS